MQLTAYIGLLFALLASLVTASMALWAAWSDRDDVCPFVEYGNIGVAMGVVFSSLILLMALAARNYAFLYVYENVDNTLNFVYTLTAFWGGREGSLLFWELIVAVSGVAFVYTPSYRALAPKTRLYFWVLFMTIQGFFLLLLTSWSNPFMTLVPTPSDGRGLNPLLRNPGMIFHPPLLFLGFAGFTIPAACALAASIAGEAKSWVKLMRNWNILAWVFLTAGIILGGWWSYMELGWGGYWAWDPVENASLIPWFAATAFLHTAIIEQRRGALQRTNVFLMSLTFLLCIFSTYLTRSGVIESLHTFGESGVSLPLFVAMVVGFVLTLVCVTVGEFHVKRSLSDMMSRQGLLVAAAWFFLALGFVVTLGTMWPVISKLWSANPVGLDQHFYNRVCLPFMSVLVFVFAFCPWLGWKGGIRSYVGIYGAAGTLVASAIVLLAMGMTKPLAVFAAASACAAVVTIVLLFVLYPGMRKSRQSWGQYGIHLGLALLALGIAFSGPYKIEREVMLAKGESVQVGDYTMTFVDSKQDSTPELRARLVGTLRVSLGEEEIGVLYPEKRIYRNFPRQQFAEVSLIPGLGDELYATLLGLDASGKLSFKISVNPLVNWIWIGGTLMCLFGFLLLRRHRQEVV
ncbi:heme lyase CcmF/NrfE family subunit [Pseudodesulfovibrio senegalensis]|uniref:Heme lyase CcmF/NrfE family subunit n=1 Tax=Pseudodesulfovibrio senegalensis TaxID=1721087 RepID=A0A6N6N698_9BACT|nr:cytochrome c-type biogenesis CcmF C-terminal domain-containing protein [Pseudodesulfovibrio senegalensis]KAB1443261.1 heme lyase CcmF/NrfE family subunit [Pseudodesulfovibrio senegalensis]